PALAQELPRGRKSLEPSRTRTRPLDRLEAEKKKRKGPWIALGVAVLLVLAGVGLGFTSYGYFGMYAIEEMLPAAGNPEEVTGFLRRAEEKASSDTYEDVRSSLTILAAARRDAGLNRRLLVRSLLHESLYQVRFGADPASA